MSATPPFKVIKKHLSVAAVRGMPKVNNSYTEILEIIALVLRGVRVDEDWYLKQYPHLAEALKAGDIKSARNHFVHSGYFEGRLPCEPELDEKWYLTEYPDVAEGIARGEIQSARDHYLEHGYAEGRFCSAAEAAL